MANVAKERVIHPQMYCDKQNWWISTESSFQQTTLSSMLSIRAEVVDSSVVAAFVEGDPMALTFFRIVV